MNIINYEKYGETHPIELQRMKYVSNNNLAVHMVTHEAGYPEAWSNLTVNLDDNLDDDCGYVDTNNNGEEILSWIEENGIGVPTGRIGYSGWCAYPEYRFDLRKMTDMM